MSNGDMERTRLANERTYLAWWRTGIAAVASGFAVGRVVPAVVQGTTWPYVAVGAALTAAGLFAFVYGTVRYRGPRRCAARGSRACKARRRASRPCSDRSRLRCRLPRARPLRPLAAHAHAVAGPAIRPIAIVTPRGWGTGTGPSALVGVQWVRSEGFLGIGVRRRRTNLRLMYEGHTISVLSGGRKRRRRHHMLAPPLWLATGAFASFVAAALVLIRI